MPKSLKRVFSDDALEKVKEHTALQGEIIYVANRLHDAFYDSFLIALSLDRDGAIWNIEQDFHKHALAIWHVLQSDSSQRELAITAISTVPTKLNLSPALRRLKWARDKAQQLWTYRNIMAHTQVLFQNQATRQNIKLVPVFRSFSMRPPQERRMDVLTGLAIWRGLRKDILYLSEYVEAINNKIRWHDAGHRGLGLRADSEWYPASSLQDPWPDRPRLRFLARLQALDRQLDQAMQRPRRRSRRRSTRA
jgi:hypothetical protein